MNLEEAKQSVGLMVMAHDSRKLSKGPHPAHGPYKLLKVTKGGMCMLERDDEWLGPLIRPTLISLPVTPFLTANPANGQDHDLRLLRAADEIRAEGDFGGRASAQE